MKMMWIVAVIVALLVGAYGGYYYEKTKMDNLMMMSQASLQKQVDDLKMKNNSLMMKQAVTPSPTGAMHPSPTSGAMMHY